jgi:predicted HTH transcriptional regulator
VTGKTADWNEIAKDCIAFANAMGGRLLVGIEDDQNAPPADQHISCELPDTMLCYSQSAISQIHQRIGGEIHPKQVKRALEELIESGAVRFEGNKRWRRYCAMP